MAFLAEQGVDYAQGYVIGRPVELAALLMDRQMADRVPAALDVGDAAPTK